MAGSQRVRRSLARTATLAERSISEFFADGCPQRAAAVSYYALLSLFPLALVTVAAFGLVVDDHVARSRVTGFVLDQLPLREGRGRTELQRTLRDVTAQAGGFGVAGLLSMMLTSSAVMGSIRQALNAAWDAVDTRPFLQAKLVDVLLVLGFGALTAASMALDLVAQLATSVVEELDAGASAAAAVAAVLLRLGRLVPVLLMLVVFTALFRLAPARDTRLRDIWPGVLVATFGFEVARSGFGFYLAVVADFGAVYASLATVVAFLVFVFVAATVLLLGAEVASEWPRVRSGESDADTDSESLGRRIRNAAKGLVVRTDDDGDTGEGEPDDSARRTHSGRRTGQLHTTVLEVARRRPDAAEAVVVSGFGPGANRDRNAIAGGAVEVGVGPIGRRARVLGAAEAAHRWRATSAATASRAS